MHQPPRAPGVSGIVLLPPPRCQQAHVDLRLQTTVHHHVGEPPLSRQLRGDEDEEVAGVVLDRATEGRREEVESIGRGSRKVELHAQALAAGGWLSRGERGDAGSGDDDPILTFIVGGVPPGEEFAIRPEASAQVDLVVLLVPGGATVDREARRPFLGDVDAARWCLTVFCGCERERGGRLLWRGRWQRRAHSPQTGRGRARSGPVSAPPESHRRSVCRPCPRRRSDRLPARGPRQSTQ